ncbi:hydrolase [Enterovibrio calviensis]|uniref:hydrolase n=1 Tax=Enterovibrio calviensis TaxID=91359 RepID=UPI0004853768|nr:hydrolase [Enterovibrio calviensis]
MLETDRTGLIVVDVQGKLARLVHDSEAFIARCETLIEGAKALDLPMIVLEQNPERLGETVDELRLHIDGFLPIAKYTFDGCESPAFIDAVSAVKNVDTWLVCGLETHICVYQTARGLLARGYHVQIVSDCVSSRTSFNREIGLTRLQQEGAKITGLEMCLYELVKDCRAPAFKNILGLVR